MAGDEKKIETTSRGMGDRSKGKLPGVLVLVVVESMGPEKKRK